MKIEVKQILKIEEGLHKGVIVGLEERTDPYKYVDVVIEFDEGKSIKVGFPNFCTTESKLGVMLAKFGLDVSTPGTFVDPEKDLMGKKCQFMTINQAKGEKTYANVIPESLKPVD